MHISFENHEENGYYPDLNSLTNSCELHVLYPSRSGLVEKCNQVKVVYLIGLWLIQYNCVPQNSSKRSLSLSLFSQGHFGL